MTTLQEAARDALEALERIGKDFVCRSAHHAKKDQHGAFAECPVVVRHTDAIESLKAALAQQGQEPEIEMIDAAMVEMANIHPPLKRSECQRLIRAALTAAPAPQPAQYVPEVGFGNMQVQAVYALLCDLNEQPPEGEHWEGFMARRIVSVLQSAQPVAQYTDIVSDGGMDPRNTHDIADIIAGELKVSRGTAYDLMRATTAREDRTRRAEKANAKKLAEKAMLEEIDAKHGCTDIAELGLPENVANPMRASGIHTIQRALVRGENEWLKTANFGRKSLSLLRESLSKYKAT